MTVHVRNVPVSHGLEWMRQALDIGRRNPRAVFGASLLMIATMLVVMVVSTLPIALVVQGREEITFGERMLAGVFQFTGLVLVSPVLLGGLVHVLHAEHGRPASASDVFAMFRQRRARPLIVLGLVQIVFNLACGALVVMLTGTDYLEASVKALEGAFTGHIAVLPQPDHPVLLFVVNLLQLAFNYFSAALMLLCVPLIALSGVGIRESLRLGFRASLVNLGANLLSSLLFLMGLIVAAIVVAIGSLIVGAIGAVVHPAFGGALLTMTWLAFGAVVLVVLVAASYYAWRDMFETPDGAGANPMPAPVMHIEA